MRAPDFWSYDSRASRALGALLSPLGWAYGATVKYKLAFARPYRSKAVVICVGNLTVGGSGKTPVTIAIARMLQAQNRKVFILTRGYGGRLSGPIVVDPELHCADDVGDEALLAARAAPVIVSRNRAAGAQLAESQGAHAIVMDDGFQNFSLAKNLSLLVIDSRRGFANGRLLPAGPLREPVQQGVARADAVILMGDDDLLLPGFAGPIIRARVEAVAREQLFGSKFIAFAGIGHPERFFDLVSGLGATIIEAHSFPDHHRYTRKDIEHLRSRSRAAGAALITTEKDFVRISRAQRSGIKTVPVQVRFQDEALLLALLNRCWAQAAIARP